YVGTSAVATATDALDFAVYPAAAASFTLYDGTALSVDVTADETKLTLASRTRPVLLDVLGAEPAVVERDGAALPKVAASTARAAAAGWSYEGGFVHVGFTTAHPTTVVTLRGVASASSSANAGETSGGDGCGCRLGGRRRAAPALGGIVVAAVALLAL